MINAIIKNRKLKEFMDKNMYLIVPIVTSIIYYTVFKDNLSMDTNKDFNSNIITISTTLIGTLFTVFSIFLALPSTNFIQLMKEFGQYQKMNNILFVGIILSFASLILALVDVFPLFKEHVFIVSITQTIYAAINLYRIAKFNAKSKSK